MRKLLWKIDSKNIGAIFIKVSGVKTVIGIRNVTIAEQKLSMTGFRGMASQNKMSVTSVKIL